MSSRWRLAAFLIGASCVALAAHCGTTDESVFPDGEGAPCDTIYKDKCGTPCGKDEDCPSGLFCAADNKCFAECAPGGRQCESAACSPRGRCGIDTLPRIDGDIPDGTGAGDACADIDVTFGKVLPTVVVLVDQSSSMTADFPPGSGASRWNVLRGALIDPDGGIIARLENEVSFGLTLYSWRTGQGVCPALASVGFKTGNYKAIYDTYGDAAPVDNTPTAESIMGVVGFDDAGALRDGGFAAATTPGPKILVLATDGDPDTCACPNCNGDQGPRDFTVWATQRTFDAGVKTYVIAIGADVDLRHQQQVANAGLGFNPDAGDAAPLFRTNDRQQLVDALNEIILGARSCKFTLNGSVIPGTEKDGTVTLNGTKLGFNDPNGWKLNTSTELELIGAACETVLKTTNAQLSVRFPCNSVLPK